MNAIVRPSGDQRGLLSPRCPLVIWIVPLPSTFARQMWPVRRPARQSAADSTYSSWRPSGERRGSLRLGTSRRAISFLGGGPGGGRVLAGGGGAPRRRARGDRLWGAVAALSKRCRAAGHQPRGVAVVAGSDIEPERIGNPHIRAHASEGKLFRTVLEDGARRAGLPCLTVLERDLFTQAAEALGRPTPDLKRAVTELGRGRDRGWRAEEKAATLAAWL